MRTLDGWQRLWVVISVLLIFPAVLLSMGLWPNRDVDIVRDLANPKCKPGLESPSGFFPAAYPSVGEPCRAHQAFEFLHERHLRSVIDYDRYLASAKVKAVGWSVFAWFAAVSTLYGAGWAVGWVIRGFRNGRS